MKLRTFQGKTMAETLARVKRELGRNAVILNTRTINEPTWLGLRSRPRVEITATDEPDLLRTAARRSAMTPRTPPGGNAPPPAAEAPADAAPPPDVEPNLHREIQSVRALVEEMLTETRRPRDVAHMPANLRGTYTQLIQNEVTHQVATDLIEQLRNELSTQQLQDPARIRNRLAAHIAEMVPAAGPVLPRADGRARVVALIGPTGVGKTTTVAKLAAQAKLRENRDVALITIDTYRIAAVDQLKTYAQIIDVPLSVVLTPDELVAAVDRHRDADLILIDTAGRSQFDTIRLNELKRFLSVVSIDEIHLVLSSTSARAHLVHAAEAFAPLGINRVIFTKLDEAVGLGVILGVMNQVRQGLSYLTTGQNVPDDIEVFDGGRFAGRVLAASSPPGTDAPAGSQSRGRKRGTGRREATR